ncbi:hypothetical protein SEA_RENNA12_69 [Arthrobacter phage Renna12]|nr:hypothetical protein SEA_RENNA12_69 [Arthrobacter phage Renna12]
MRRLGLWLCRQGFHGWELWVGWRARPVEVCRRCGIRKDY